MGSYFQAPDVRSIPAGQGRCSLTQIPRTPAFSVRSAHPHGSVPVPVRLWFGRVRGTHGVPRADSAGRSAGSRCGKPSVLKIRTVSVRVRLGEREKRWSKLFSPVTLARQYASSRRRRGAWRGDVGEVGALANSTRTARTRGDTPVVAPGRPRRGLTGPYTACDSPGQERGTPTSRHLCAPIRR